MNEKFCALRTANTLQSHKKARVNRQHQTAEARGGAVNCNRFNCVDESKKTDLFPGKTGERPVF